MPESTNPNTTDFTELNSDVFTSVTFNGLTLNIYKDARDQTKYYYVPLFLCLQDGSITDSRKPEVSISESNPKVIKVQVQLKTDELLKEIREHLKNDFQVSNANVLQMPLTRVVFTPIDVESLGVINVVEFPDENSNSLSFSDTLTLRFRCGSTEIAKIFSKALKNNDVGIQARIFPSAVSIKQKSFTITNNSFKNVNWKNQCVPNSTGIDDPKQYFTLDQLAESFGSILNQISIVQLDLNAEDDQQISEEEKKRLFSTFVETLTKAESLDLIPDEAHTIYVGKETFTPDRIGDFQLSKKEFFSQNLELIYDTTFESLKQTSDSFIKTEVLDKLEHSKEKLNVSAGMSNSASAFDFLSNSFSANGKYSSDDDFLKTMHHESHQSGSSSFSDSTKATLHSDYKSSFQSNQEFELKQDQELIIPKKIKVVRVVSSNMNSTQSWATVNLKIRIATRVQDVIIEPTNTLDQSFLPPTKSVNTLIEEMKDELRKVNTQVGMSNTLIEELNDRLRKVNTQTGTFNGDRQDPAWTLDEGAGERLYRKNIIFESSFMVVPQVTVALWHIDAGVEPQGMLIAAWAENITTDGFVIVFKTWAEVKIPGASVSWLAFGA